MISRQCVQRLLTVSSRRTAMMSRFYSSAGPVKSSSTTATRKRREEAQALRDSFKFNLIDNGEEDDETLRQKKLKRTYEPNPEVPILDNLASRWDKMDSLDQEEIVLYLEDRMRGDWKEMSDLEKKSALFVAYGPWGPRAQTKDSRSGYEIFVKIVLVSMILVGGYQIANRKAGYFNPPLLENANSTVPEQKEEQQKN
ncbi:uncharacterized protein SAPINGB_P001258 [Magnusiomyces paraingens]|uniref:Uncharacterized protein n=1 Tax=Magnusiomyces paraingens TaxID=2606893 RepID=A0A5E8B6M2_9ASCO|nr:uncharacterized protein SAPINGB_P001258 [Saprochaete ingens]VVT46528.1 unnamed protein product [Saprochaete ingens]